MTCANCGRENPTDARFCCGCGRPLHATSSPRFPVGTAERRQLTVLFADLMESTSLSERLDPEVLRRLIRSYQETCVSVMRRFEGYLAQYLGDGVLLFFGYPVAHEDAALRAVRTALGILGRIRELNRDFKQELGLELGVRIGIHTGTVVVEHLVEDGLQTPMATGEATNVAARIQSLAERNSVVVTSDTFRLVAPYVRARDLGPHTLRGLARPVTLHHVLGESGSLRRSGAVASSTPFVGRRAELAELLGAWQATVAGPPPWALISGEPGIGKSRLVDTLVDCVEDGGALVLEAQCSPFHQNSAFAPVSDLISRRLGLVNTDAVDARLGRLEADLERRSLPPAEYVPLLAPLFDLPVGNRYPAQDLTPQRRRQKVLEALVSWLLAVTRERSVLLVVEDLHWADPSTIELLGLVQQAVASRPLFLLLTARPEFHTPWPPGAQGRTMNLNRLAEAEVSRLATEVARGRRLPASVLREIVQRTDGVPLFIEELTRMILESDLVQEVDGQVRLARPFPKAAIPATIQDSLMARLDRLGTAKPLAQLGAVLGRTFRQDVLEAVTEPGTTPRVEAELGRLVSAGLLARLGPSTPATYSFRHALIQDAAYESLLKATRQQHHSRIGEVLRTRFPEVAASQPEVLAHHFTAAGLTRPAIQCWYRAGEAAVARSANVEAMSHFRRGLELLAGLPPAPDLVPIELQLLLSLGAVLVALQGYASPEVGRVFGRARELCLQLGARPQLGPAFNGLWAYSIVRCEYAESTALADQMLAMAAESRDPDLDLEAAAAAGINSFWASADLPGARRHLERALSLYDVKHHHTHALIYSQDPGVTSMAHLVWTLYLLGYPEQATACVGDLRRLARARGHAYSTGYAYAWENTFWFLARRVGAARQATAEGLRFCAEQGFPLWQIVAAYVGAWARTASGEVTDAAREIRQVLTAWRATGATVSQSFQMSILAEVHRLQGDTGAALADIDEALALTRSCGDLWYRPELLRFRGELLAARGDDPGLAETCFREALEQARSLQARMWELRAAVALSRLFIRTGRSTEVRPLLAPIHGWFTEGGSEPEWIEAGRLLDPSAAPPILRPSASPSHE